MSKLLFDDTSLAVQLQRRRRRDAVRPGPALPAARGDPAGRAERRTRPSTRSAWASRSTRTRRSTRTQPAPYGYTFDDPAEHPVLVGAGRADRVADRAARRSTSSTSTTSGSRTSSSRSSRSPTSPAATRRSRRTLAQSLASQISFGLLSEVEHVHVPQPERDAVDRAVVPARATSASRHHISQATLDEHAIVFTTHPKNEPQSGTQWPDDDGYWTGNGSLPRAAQHGAVSISLYAPAFAPTGSAARLVRLPRLHARVLPAGALRRGGAAGGWTFGRRATATSRCGRGGRRTGAPTTTPGSSPTASRSPFDLVADGGADNMWITQVGDAAKFGSFAAFRTAVLGRAGAGARRDRRPRPGCPGGFDVAWDSPTEGPLTFGTTAPLTVKGAVEPIDGYPRYDNPWSHDAVRLAGREDRGSRERREARLRQRSSDRHRSAPAATTTGITTVRVVRVVRGAGTTTGTTPATATATGAVNVTATGDGTTSATGRRTT